MFDLMSYSPTDTELLEKTNIFINKIAFKKTAGGCEMLILAPASHTLRSCTFTAVVFNINLR